MLINPSSIEPVGGCRLILGLGALQAVRATRASVKLSESHDRVASCPPFQWDDMLFAALFK